MLSASDISCIGDLDRAGHAGVERLHQQRGVRAAAGCVAYGPVAQAARQRAGRMEVPLGGRDDAVALYAAVHSPQPVQQQSAGGFGQAEADARRHRDAAARRATRLRRGRRASSEFDEPRQRSAPRTLLP